MLFLYLNPTVYFLELILKRMSGVQIFNPGIYEGLFDQLNVVSHFFMPIYQSFG